MKEYDYLIKGDMYQYNLGWLINELLSFKNDLATAIDLRTIKYADPIQWNITTQYPANTVVIDSNTGIAYMSKTAVPQGIPLSNTDYWTVIFDYAAIYNNIMRGVAFNEENNEHASKDMLVNDLVWFGGKLYRVTKPITAGGQYLPDNNIVITSIENLLSTYYGRDRVAQVLNDTLNVSGDYTINAGDIAESSTNSTEKVTGDKVIDVDGNFRIKAGEPLQYGDPKDYDERFDSIKLKDSSGVLYNVLVGGNKLFALLPALFTSPEEFGAVGDGVTDDTTAWKNCLTNAKSTGKIISTPGGKTYKITTDLTFDSVKAFGLGTLQCNDCKIIVQNSSIVKYLTILNGSLLMDAYYSDVSMLTIRNYDGTCISFQSADELPDRCEGNYGLHDFLIDNYQLHATNAVGVNCNHNDLKIRNGTIINCNTAIIYNGGNILIDNIHMWINAYVDFSTSVAFDIRQTGFRIVNCTVDTYGLVFKMPGTYYSGIVTALDILHNWQIRPNVEVAFINNHNCTIRGQVFVRMTGWATHGVTFKQFDKSKCTLQTIDGSPSDNYYLDTAKLTSSYGGTITSNTNITTDDNQIWLDIHITYSGNGMTSTYTDLINLFDLDEGYRGAFDGYVPAIYTKTDGTQEMWNAHVFIASGNLRIKPNHGALPLKEIHINMPVRYW